MGFVVFDPARPLTAPLPPRARCESVAQWEDWVFVGLSSGEILSYQLSGAAMVLRRTTARACPSWRSGGAVRRLLAVPKWGRLLALADGIVAAFEFGADGSLPLDRAIEDGAADVCVGKGSTVLAVALRSAVALHAFDGRSFYKIKVCARPVHLPRPSRH